MVKISYYDSDKEATKLIEEYYWFKYMVKMIYNDWKYVEETEKLNATILNDRIKCCLNIHDIDRLNNILNILEKQYPVNHFESNIDGFLTWLFVLDDTFFIARFKGLLVKKYGN
jgi:hypothetical protein